MRIKKAATALLLALLFAGCALFNAGCHQNDYMDLFAFSSPVHIEVYDGAISQNSKSELNLLFSRYEKNFSISAEDSFTARFNALGAGESIALNGDAANVLQTAYGCNELTNGLFDPTVLPLTKLWRFYPNFPVVDFVPPNSEQLAELLSSGAVGIGGLDWNKEKATLTKLNKDMGLDFGGILKGYCADLAGKILKDDGRTQGYVNVGGSSLYILSTENLFITHPRKQGNIANFNLTGKSDISVSTSGDYEKSYTYSGKQYCHIIHPKTGKTADTGVASVTFIGKGGAVADAVTTALCLCSHSPSNPSDPKTSPLVALIKKITAQLENSVIFAVYDDGKVRQIITNAPHTMYELLDKDYSVVNI